MSTFEKDFFLRQIRQLAAFLRRILLRAEVEHKYDEALHELRKAVGELFGVNVELLEMVDCASVAALLNWPEKITAYARVLVEQAKIEALRGQACAAAQQRRRALELYVEAALRQRPDAETQAEIQALCAQVDPATLDERYRTWLTQRPDAVR